MFPRLTFKPAKNREQHKHVTKQVSQEPKVSRAGSIARFKMIVSLPDIHMNGHKGNHTEKKRNQNTPGPFRQKLFPATATHRKTNSHTRDKEQERNTPY